MADKKRDPQKQIDAGIKRILQGDGELSQQQAGYKDKNASFSQQVKNRLGNPLSSAFNTTLSLLSRGAQLAPRYINASRLKGEELAQTTDAYSPERILKGIAAQPGILKDTLAGLTDVKGQNDVTLSKAITGQNATSGLGKAADIAGSIVLDPTTYVGVGLLGDAGKAARAATEAKFGTKAAEQLNAKGLRALAAPQQRAVEQVIADAAKAPGLQGDTGLGKLLRQGTGRSVRDAETKFIDDASKQLAQPQGLKFAGRTVVSGDAAKSALAAVPGLKAAGNAAGESSSLRAIRKAVTPRLEISQNLGKAAESGANTARARAEALTSRLDSADLAHVEAALKPTNIKERALGGAIVSEAASKLIDKAIDTGRLADAVNILQRSGNSTAANYAKALNDVHTATDKRIGGLASLSNGAKIDSGTFNKAVESKIARMAADATPQQKLLVRSQLANELIGRHERLAGLSQITVDGKPLAIPALDGAEMPAGYVKIGNKVIGDVFAPKEIADDVRKAYKAFESDDDMRTVANAAKAMSGAWRNLALNTFVLSTGTAVRNAVTDVMMMSVRGGFKDPGKYKPAVKAIKAMQSATDKGQDILTASKSANLTPWERRGLAYAIKEGVVTSGLFTTDVAAKGLATTQKDLLKQSLNVANRKNIATRTLGNANEKISNTNRLALFYDVFSRTGNPALAARTVREALIDYSDLTKYETGAKRWLIPFYTFTARNLTNQVWSLAHTPGRALTIEKIREGIFGQQDPDGAVPDYLLANGQQPFFDVNGTPILSNIQSPLQAAGQTLQPLADVASTLGLPGTQQTEAGFGGAAAGALQNVGGFEAGLLKNAAQEASGTNLFTGAPLPEDQSGWKRLAQSLVPSEGKAESTAKDLKSDDKAVQVARVLSLLGLTSTANTDARQTSEQYRRIRELGTTANRQSIPTLTEQKKGKKKNG